MRSEHFEIANVKALHFQYEYLKYSKSNEWTMEPIGVTISETPYGTTAVKLELGCVDTDEKDNLLSTIINTGRDDLYLGFQLASSDKEVHQSVGLGECNNFRFSHGYGITQYAMESERTYDEIVNNIHMAIANGLELEQEQDDIEME